MGLQLQVSARSKAAAVPPGGPRRLRELHLFIIAIYIVPGICRRLQQPHALIRPRHALGAGACLEVGEMDPVLESPSAPTWPLGQAPLFPRDEPQPGHHSLFQQLLDTAAQARLGPPGELSSNCSEWKGRKHLSVATSKGADGSWGKVPAPGHEMRSLRSQGQIPVFSQSTLTSFSNTYKVIICARPGLSCDKYEHFNPFYNLVNRHYCFTDEEPLAQRSQVTCSRSRN